jgi:flagellar biogenesis protein FliO
MSRAQVGTASDTNHEPRGDVMYIGGGVLALILIVLLLIWLL